MDVVPDKGVISSRHSQKDKGVGGQGRRYRKT